MPKSLKEYYREKDLEFNEAIKNIPKPDFTRPGSTYSESFDYATKMGEIDYKRNALRSSIVNALNDNLTDEQLGAIYDKLHNDNMDERITKRYFISRVRERRTANFSRAFTTSVDNVLDAFEEALGPEQTKKIVEAPLLAPNDPANNDKRIVKPMQGRLDELEQEYNAKEKDPVKQQEMQQVLKRASVCLEDPDPALLAYYDKVYDQRQELTGFQFKTVLDHMPSVKVDSGIKKLAGGKFADTMVRETNSDGSPRYDPQSVSQFGRPLSEEDKKELSDISKDRDTGLSQDTIDAVNELSEKFDALDYSTHANNVPMRSKDFPTLKHPGKDDVCYANEQGRKYYAFWPLVYTKMQLRRAVIEGDLDKVRELTDKYEQQDRHMQSMMDIVHSDKLSSDASFSGNVNSTRSDTGLMPEKYATDYIGHNKLNSLYEIHAFSKNTGISAEELAKDPYGTAIKATDNYFKVNGLDGRDDSIGEALALNTKQFRGSDPTGQLMYGSYTSDIVNTMQRGQAGILALEKDPEKQAQYLVLANLGVMEATKTALKERDLQNALYYVFSPVSNSFGAQTTKEQLATRNQQRHAIYANAAILPETGPDRFNMRKIAESIAKTGEHADDWKQDLSVEDWINGTKPVDYAMLATRNEKLIRDFEHEQDATGCYHNKFNKDEYLRCAFRAHSALLKNAPEEVKNTKGFRDFKKSVLNMYKLADSPETKAILKFGAMQLEGKDPLDLLKTGTDGQLKFWDSSEYKQMKESVGKIKTHIERLQSRDYSEFNKTSASDLPEALQSAADDTYEYLRLKLDNGNKAGFHYTSGEQRAKESLQTLRSVRAAQDELGLRSPARKMYEDAQLELLLHRGDRAWMEKNGPAMLANMLYAKGYMESGIPEEEQAKLFEQNKHAGVRNMLNSKVIDIHRKEMTMQHLYDSALEDSEPFKGYAEDFGKGLGKKYNEAYPPEKKEIRENREKFAMKYAASKLGTGPSSINYSERNKDLMDKTKEVLKDQNFKDAMRYMESGRMDRQLPDDPTELSSDKMTEMRFDAAFATVAYEKHCAEITSRAMLKSQGIEEPSREQINNAGKILRKDPRFRDYCFNALQGKTASEINDLNDKLYTREGAGQAVQDICSRLAQPPKLELNKAIHQPQAGPVINSAPVA